MFKLVFLINEIKYQIMEVITLVYNTGFCGDGNGVKLDLTTMQQFNQERYLLNDKKISFCIVDFDI